jgi:hypothetical protein
VKEILGASPRISTADATEYGLHSLIEIKESMSPPPIWKENVPGVSGVGMGMNNSNDEIADVVALKIPYLSQLKYL